MLCEATFFLNQFLSQPAIPAGIHGAVAPRSWTRQSSSRVNKLVDLAEVPSGTLMDKRQLPIRAIPWQKSKNRAVYIGEG